ncbi:MAG: ABC transporter ATP-binding protein [Clostridia bacterium]|nr:ABC transporter ATP-binding protein [Clostridia bacterium]
MSAVIKVDNVSMMFNLSSEKIDSIKEYLIKMLKKEMHFQEFWALNNVSFELERGDSLGIIGLNGSGKSTLLKIVSGILKPTKGTVTTVGSIAPLIELGAGFDPDLTARENIYLNGAILGYSREYMKSRFDEIIEFAELEDFVDTSIKNFSSGMVARLGFAIATMNIPDILIIDEILAVGDYKFQQKSFKRMQEMINSGATVVFVSHSVEQVKEICKKALWLEHGNVVKFGPAEEICTEYMNS